MIDSTSPLPTVTLSEADPICHPLPVPQSEPATISIKPLQLVINTNTSPTSSHSHTLRGQQQPSSKPNRHNSSALSSLDPLVDITRLRLRPQRHHCLYQGSQFQGTQKSGRNSYEVHVTIVDVDFNASFLCGYLRIKGLTDDWPELTTYFDAEIIGSRYGFLTQKWGANEHEDQIHWSRFPAYHHVVKELKKPHLTIPDRDRGAIFMRWKERFLVPDHRVQDISGASFAGFYYVCVDFNPPARPPASAVRPGAHAVSMAEDRGPLDSSASLHSPSKLDNSQRSRRDSTMRSGGRSVSLTPRSNIPIATMSGFYFHQNSEPYQQLSLHHVQERTSSSFESR